MTLPLTPEMLAHAYEYLACQKPFSSWNLPPAEDVKFAVIRHKDRFAHYQMRGGEHHLEFSKHCFARHEVLIATMAHELIHLHAELAEMATGDSHGKAFQKIADRVCKIHSFDRTTF